VNKNNRNYYFLEKDENSICAKWYNMNCMIYVYTVTLCEKLFYSSCLKIKENSCQHIRGNPNCSLFPIEKGKEEKTRVVE